MDEVWQRRGRVFLVAGAWHQPTPPPPLEHQHPAELQRLEASQECFTALPGARQELSGCREPPAAAALKSKQRPLLLRTQSPA